MSNGFNGEYLSLREMGGGEKEGGGEERDTYVFMIFIILYCTYDM